MTDNSLSQAEHDAITDAAAQWCMRLHASDCTAQERIAFEHWRDAHPLHAFEYEAMLEIWEVAGDLHRPDAVDPIARSRPVMPWRTLGIAAAVCALAVPLALYGGWNMGWLPNSYQHFEARDTVRQITLTVVCLLEFNLGC